MFRSELLHPKITAIVFVARQITGYINQAMKKVIAVFEGARAHDFRGVPRGRACLHIEICISVAEEGHFPCNSKQLERFAATKPKPRYVRDSGLGRNAEQT